MSNIDGIVTRRGVYKDITQSDFKVKINDCLFYFTSYANVKRFLRKIPTLDDLKDIVNEIHVNNIQMFSLVNTYEHIEKRGFRIIWKGVEYLCREDMDITIEIVNSTISQKENNNLSYDKRKTKH